MGQLALPFFIVTGLGLLLKLNMLGGGYVVNVNVFELCLRMFGYWACTIYACVIAVLVWEEFVLCVECTTMCVLTVPWHPLPIRL